MTVSSNKYSVWLKYRLLAILFSTFFFLYSIFYSFVVVVIPNLFSSELIELRTSEG